MHDQKQKEKVCRFFSEKEERPAKRKIHGIYGISNLTLSILSCIYINFDTSDGNEIVFLQEGALN